MIYTSLTSQVISHPHRGPQRTSPSCQTVCMLTWLWMMSQWHSQPSLPPQQQQQRQQQVAHHTHIT